MTRLTYLCLYIAHNKKESDYFFTEIENYQWTPHDTPHTIYYIALHSTIHSRRNGVWKWQDGILEGPLYQSSAKNWNSIFQSCLRHLLPKHFDGFIYSGHGGTVSIGSWFRNSSAFLKISNLISLFVKYNMTFPVMLFNSCYMGGLLSLLECNRITSWVAADPGYSGWESITNTSSFWKRSGAIGPWLSASVHEYAHRFPRCPYKCYMAFDLHVLPALFRELKKTDPMKWAWKKKYLLSSYDTSTYDILSVLKDEKKLVQLIHHMMRFSVTCDKKKGPSIQWGRITHMEYRYEGTIWWDYWKNINTCTVSSTLSENKLNVSIK